MFAARPFWLEDLVEACATLLRNGYLFNGDARPQSLDLIEPLSGLIHIQPPISEAEYEQDEPRHRAHTVNLAHFSVREFLQQLENAAWNLERPFFNPLEAEWHLAQACFAYIVHCQNEQRSKPHEQFPMLPYARGCWSHHTAAYIQAKERT